MQGRLKLVRSDRGDGGWSLHPPEATDEEIASGRAPVLASGGSQYHQGAGIWLRPHDVDYQHAYAELARRAACEAKHHARRAREAAEAEDAPPPEVAP